MSWKILGRAMAFAAALFGFAGFADPAFANIGDFVGSWLNTDPNTGGMTHVIIRQTGSGQVSVHVFGSCQPTDCDWGVAQGHTYTDGVSSPDVRSIVATFHSNVSDDEIVFRRSGGSLKIQLFVAFTDGSGRYDYIATGKFDPAPQFAWPLPPGFPPSPGFGGGGPGGAGLGGGSGGIAEDCVGFSESHASVAFVNGSWKLVDGPHWIADFGSNQGAAMEALHVVHHYHFDAQCFVTRASGSQMTYWKSGGHVPNNSLSHSDCIPLHTGAVEAVHVSGSWKVVDTANNGWLLDYGPNKPAADEAVGVIQSYGLNRQCFVNRSPGPAMMQYWLSH